VQTGQASLLSIQATAFKTKNEIATEKIISINGLGTGGKSISRYPFTGASFKKDEYGKAPYVEYELSVNPGEYQLVLKCLPTHAIHKGRNLGMAISINDAAIQFVDIDNPQEDKRWKTDILRGYSESTLPLRITNKGVTKVRIYLLDTGLALSKVDVRNN